MFLMDYDADQAARNIYFDYLADRFNNDPAEGRRRAGQFESGHPVPQDLAAITACGDAYEKNAGNGRALDAARDAFYAELDREDVKKKEVDPKRYSVDPEYHGRMNALIDDKVEERRQDRQNAREKRTVP